MFLEWPIGLMLPFRFSPGDGQFRHSKQIRVT